MDAITKISELLRQQRHQRTNDGQEDIPPLVHIMDIAREIAAKNPDGLMLLSRALLRPVQAERLIAVAERPPHALPAELRNIYFFFPVLKVASSDELILQPTPAVKVSLATDIVLPAPWQRDRYVDALAHIGTGKALGPWRRDSNHVVSVWRPWNIAFVLGGNHSIATGILLGEGEIVADEVWDLTPIFDRVVCDGAHYINVQTGERIAEVTDHRRAAVFEIGRLMMESAKPTQAPDQRPQLVCRQVTENAQ